MKQNSDRLIAEIWLIFDSLMDSPAPERIEILRQLRLIAAESCTALAMSSYYADDEKRQIAGKETSWPLLVPAENRDEAKRWLAQVLDDLRLGEDVGLDVHRRTRGNKDPQRITFATFLFKVLNHQREILAWDNLSDSQKEPYEYLAGVWETSPHLAYERWKKEQAVGQSVQNESNEPMLSKDSQPETITTFSHWKFVAANLPPLGKLDGCCERWAETACLFLQWRASESQMNVANLALIPDSITSQAKKRAKGDSGSIESRLLIDIKSILQAEFKAMAKN
jgi:hypothetical protein